MLDSPLGGISREILLFSRTGNEPTSQKLKKKKNIKHKTVLVIDHPQVAKAKFGYRSERRIDFLVENPIIFWLDVETYCLNLAISELLS
jgi:hypothetical protein